MGPNRGQNGVGRGAKTALRQTELPLGTESKAEQVMDALDGITAGVEALKESVMALVRVSASLPPPPSPPAVRLAPVSPLAALEMEGRPVHAFHIRLSEGEMENLRRLAQLSHSSQQRISRIAVREYCERLLKEAAHRE